MKLLRAIFTVCIVALVSYKSISQELTGGIALVGRESTDSILLRWIPDKASIWSHAKVDGYKISKVIYNGEDLTDLEDLDFVELNNSTVTRWSPEKLESYLSSTVVDEESREFQVASFAYGLSYPVTTEIAKESLMRNIFQDDLNTLREEKSKMQQSFLLAMLPCEQSRFAATITGYMISDNDVIPNQTYIYKIELAVPHPTYNVKPGYLKITAKKYDSSKYRTKIYKKAGDSKLSYSWQDLPYISSYHIDRSLDGHQYERITKTPIGNVSTPNYRGKTYTSYTDDSLVVGQKYYYRFYAQTPFADEYMFGESTGIPIDLTPPARPFIDSLEHIERNKIIIHWNNDQYVDENIKGFIIGRSASDTSQFYRIHEGMIPPDFNKFEDIYFTEGASNYYKISVVDEFENISYSDSRLLVLKDEYPPAPPEPISGIMDSSGVVTLTLNSQMESDFMGYRVYKSNANYHEYSVYLETWNDSTIINPRDTIILDSTTLETLTEEIFYKVTALDYHYNESFFSDSIKVTRPDIIPPVAPIISDYSVLDGSVELNLTLSSSNDVVTNYLYRRAEGTEEWETLDSLASITDVYKDTTVQVQKAYEYIMQAKDDAGLYSEYSNRVRVKTYFKPRPVNMDIDCQYFVKDKKVLLSWKLNEELSEAIRFSVRNNKQYFGKTLFDSTVFAFSSSESLPQIEMIGETNTKSFLTNHQQCNLNQDDIQYSELYKTFLQDYDK